MPPDIEIIVGTYEEFLVGYQFAELDQDGETSSKFRLKQTFAEKSHAGSIKSMAVQGPWVATGGIDDRIFVYDMRIRKQCQILLSHAGTVNTLTFSPDLTHLISGSADGHMIATRVATWTTEADWCKPHAGKPVTHISCHPSSKLALSLGGDLVLNTWNLVKGRVAYRTNLKSKKTLGSAPDCLSWSTSGDHFTLSGPLLLEIWEIKNAQVVRRAKTPAKPVCVSWLNAKVCLAGLENGSIAWTSLEDDLNAAPKIIPAHDESRVKAMACLNETLVTACSSGEIKVWRCSLDKQKLTELASTNIDCRPTGLGLLDLSKFGNVRAQMKPIKVEDKAAPMAETPKVPTPRGYVTIEYEQDEQTKVEAEAKKTSKKKQPKGALPKPKDEDTSEDSNSDEEEDSDELSDSNSDASSDAGDRRRRPLKRKQPPAVPASSQRKGKQQRKK
ncbi:hypothetical protein KR059_010593 [Drosophila kikkawai]|nr:hypothetical protein KR059_010593 [Drosophila kikkawai]